MENQSHKQPYNNLLKRLVQNQPNAILPMLFPDLLKEVIGPLNIEILIPPRRTDRVYKILPVDGEEELLRDELLCFRTMLNRAKRLPAPEFKKVDRRLRMFDPLLEEDPWVKEKIAEGKTQGVAEERLRSIRSSILTTVNTRFPSLIELAETKARQTEQWDALNALFIQLLAANGEQTAREILEQFSVV